MTGWDVLLLVCAVECIIGYVAWMRHARTMRAARRCSLLRRQAG